MLKNKANPLFTHIPRQVYSRSVTYDIPSLIKFISQAFKISLMYVKRRSNITFICGTLEIAIFCCNEKPSS